jgi:pyrimidine-nucleoside phosphorylase
MRMVDIILKKRNGHALTKEEIEFFVQGYTKGEVPDYQVSALLMAIYFQKMNKEETINLTLAMVNSGVTIDLSGISGIKVDKHSTGGVGDTTTLVVGPMVASIGVPVAKMSGRGLGHTGGTIDKLESFQGFSTGMTKESFTNSVNDIGIAVGGQTGDLAPADKKLYALRDVTGTVDNISLIAGSIMSKKLASGADAIVLDVKTGSGAFMKDLDSAFLLAEEMVNIGNGVGKNTVAIITDMDQPLGFAVGNSLEVIEAIDTLKGKGPKDLEELCIELGAHMTVLNGKTKDLEEAKALLKQSIITGSAFEKFKQFIVNQGGQEQFIDNTKLLPKAEYVVELLSQQQGYIDGIEAEQIGQASLVLGAGRETKESVIDLGVGVVLHKKIGDYVSQGEKLATIYYNDEKKVEDAKASINKAYSFSNNAVNKRPLILGIVSKDGTKRF